MVGACFKGCSRCRRALEGWVRDRTRWSCARGCCEHTTKRPGERRWLLLARLGPCRDGGASPSCRPSRSYCVRCTYRQKRRDTALTTVHPVPRGARGIWSESSVVERCELRGEARTRPVRNAAEEPMSLSAGTWRRCGRRATRSGRTNGGGAGGAARNRRRLSGRTICGTRAPLV